MTPSSISSPRYEFNFKPLLAKSGLKNRLPETLPPYWVPSSTGPFDFSPDYDQPSQNSQPSQMATLWTPQPGPQTTAFESDADEILYGGEPGGGKGASIAPVLYNGVMYDVTISTPFGPKLFRDVVVGDQVSNPDGSVARVIQVHELGVKPIYRVECIDGAATFVTDDHRWLVSVVGTALKAERRFWEPDTDGWSDEVTKGFLCTTLDLKRYVDAAAATVGDGEKTRWPLIPLTSPVEYTVTSRNAAARWPIHPYLLGVLLGDGSLSTKGRPTWSKPDDFIAERVESFGYRVRTGPDGEARFIVDDGETKAALVHLGLDGARSWEKRIPDAYKVMPVASRWELARGLFDTDGTADSRGHVSYSSSSELLARDVQWVVRSLGFKATLTSRETHYTRPDLGGERHAGRTAYQLEVQGNACPDLFSLPRKRDRCRSGFNGGQESKRRVIKVDYVGDYEARCITVNHPNGLYVTDDFIVTHNSDWLLGHAIMKHTRSHLFRRDAGQLGELTDRIREITGETGRVTESPRPLWRSGDKRIEMAGLVNEADAMKWAGRAGDFKGFDELPQFTRTQYLTVSGWGRSAKAGQRVQTAGTCNPPIDEDGLWVVERWAPWLDPTHEHPAASGEIRWFANIGGVDTECEDGEPFTLDGETYYPSSRTFIRARLEDNAYLGDDYRRKLDALPEPMRTIFKTSDFMALLQTSHPLQVIKTEWVRAAQARWRPGVPEGPDGKPIKQSCVALDVAEGGRDRTVLARRYGDWFAMLESKPGAQTPHASDAAAMVEAAMLGPGYAIVDADGVGAGAYGILYSKYKNRARAFRGVKPTLWRDASGMLEYANVKAAAWWCAAEALNPKNGRQIALPPGNDLLAELCSVRWKMSGQRIIMEPKEETKSRLGRSPDLADPVVMALWDGQSLELADSIALEYGT